MKIQKDVNYFNKIDTEEKAYILGFIMADGCISGNRVNIKLGLKDIELLKTISIAILGFDHTKFVKPTGVPYFIDGREIKNSGAVCLNITCKEWIPQLDKLKCIPAKSLILEFPDLDDEYLPRFIRGYFDGDGCLSSRKHSGARRFT